MKFLISVKINFGGGGGEGLKLVKREVSSFVNKRTQYTKN